MSIGIDIDGCVPGADGWDADECGSDAGGRAGPDDTFPGWVGTGADGGSGGTVLLIADDTARFAGRRPATPNCHSIRTAR